MAANSLENSLLNFSLDLYNKLLVTNGQRENIVYSPLSIAAALSMILAGARNDTAKQLSAALHVELTKQPLHELFSRALASICECGSQVQLLIASRIYLDTSFPVLDGYLNFLNNFGAELKSVNFGKEHERIRLEINSWVEEVTASKIKDLLDEDSIDRLTALALVNAVYFKGLWATQFRLKATWPSSFYLDLKRTTRVDMMHQEGDYRISSSDKLQARALEIPYRGGKTSMVILLPDAVEGLSYLEEHLSAGALMELLQKLKMTSEVDVYLPKFKVEQKISLKYSLNALGVKYLFTSEADLSGISPKTELAVSDVVHRVLIEVDERGTEAAAATCDVICHQCAYSTMQFMVDRPFMFLIRCHEPDLILFAGSVRRP